MLKSWSEDGRRDACGTVERKFAKARLAFVGVVSDGVVRGVWSDDGFAVDHKAVGYKEHDARFRFFPRFKGGAILWQDSPSVDADARFAVENWIDRPGWPVRLHDAAFEQFDDLPWYD